MIPKGHDQCFFFRRQAQAFPGLKAMIVYKDGEWQRFVEPDPWVSEKDEGHTGFYEDRLSFLLDDGSVRGFQNFGGWLTAHRDGMRSLPGEVDRDDVVEHPHLGIKLERNDVRKYIPHSRKGEWWEGSWDEILSEEVLERMKEAGVFLELPMWRAHRSNDKIEFFPSLIYGGTE